MINCFSSSTFGQLPKLEACKTYHEVLLHEHFLESLLTTVSCHDSLEIIVFYFHSIWLWSWTCTSAVDLYVVA
ncbi:hypothetical protein CDL12_20707 [Handroanthus impetiginosus]|uniref:Uncharacterized protein n=1 Tax=Handroanthus impetiginosus TaxID=429701 RepID=A0A2G9GP14_9LAMI|nr:hypothetical protein CDL12_20707 [Handroanthus impetiginosus]